MDWEAEGKKALKRIEKLEEEVSALTKRISIQYDATDKLRKRVGKLERERNA